MTDIDHVERDFSHSQQQPVDRSKTGELELTILMPCLNEAETLKSCLTKARSFLDRTAIIGEIIVADNGSTDGSVWLARQEGVRVVSIETPGYGAALIGGIKAAGGKYVIMADSDGSYDFSKLDEFVSSLRCGADLVVGNRFLGGIARGAMPPLHRYFGNPVLSFIGRLFFRSPVRDFHCGLRGFRREIIDRLRLKSDGMEFASEMVVMATLRNLQIIEVATSLSPDGRSRPPHLRSWRDGWRHLKLLLTFAPDWLFLYPGILLSAVGIAIVSVLSFGPVDLGAVRLDIASLILGLAALLTGVQLLSFHLLAHRHAVNSAILPRTPIYDLIEPFITVDRACLFGFGFIMLGILSAAVAVIIWIGEGLGDLDPSRIARPVTWSVLGLSIGLQLITGGFLWQIVGSREYMPDQDEAD